MPRRKSESDERPELSRLEVEVMDIVWRLTPPLSKGGPGGVGAEGCSSGEVIAEYEKIRPLAPTTIRTVLTNLRKKGYLEPVPTIEPGYRFRPTVNRESVVRRTLKTLVSGLLGGSPRQAIAYLLKDENLNDADLEEIRRLVESPRKGKRS